MRALWDESFSGVIQRPRPVQRPHPPIVIGGHSPSAYRRAIRSGNGWYGWELTPEEAAGALAELRRTAERVERPAELGELEITVTPPRAPDLDTARRYADVGVYRLLVKPHTTAGSAMDDLIASVGDTIIGKL
jgi:alkanesulfonate monooxygenase SsuD/methylene tetrahydromethanopterin reductase-like flavin-dependent oxidoreductase (luciferase family)